MERIVIKALERPDFNDPEKLIRWFCTVFGLTGDEETAGISEQILSNFATAAYMDKGLSSSELKLHTELARSTVIYHLNRFIDSGLVVKRGRKYYLRASEMSKAIEEIEYDIDREFSRMLDTAREFDKIMFMNMKKLSAARRGAARKPKTGLGAIKSEAVKRQEKR